MVSTRGGARTGTDELAQTDGLALRKKPVRKAAAKPTAKTTAKPAAKAAAKTSTSTQPATKTRATRSKRIEPELEQETVNDEVDELDQEEPGEEIKVARKVTSRAKKTEEPKKNESAPKARNTSARTTASRTAKSRSVEDDAPSLPLPTNSAATRATRATASKSKATPLSPKKITQVARAPVRSTRNAKPPASKPARPTAAAKPATRRRNVSDENVDVDIARSVDEEVEHSTKEVPNTRTAPVKSVVAQSKITEDETPMSSRPTTPAGSPPPNLDDEQDDEATDVDNETESEAEDEHEISADELFGPKTPMKRVSPRGQSRFISAQKSPQRDVVPMATPARRFAVLGTQRGTPQTQKPYCKPTVPSSEVRSMTVARARDRAMVLPKLQPIPIVAAPDVKMKPEEEDSELEQSGPERPSEGDMGAVMAEEDLLDQSNNGLEEQEVSQTIPHGEDMPDPKVEATEEPEDLTINFGEDPIVPDEQLAEQRQEPVIHFSMEDVRLDVSAEKYVDDREGETLPDTQAYDPNETIIEDQEMEDVSEERGNVSGCSDDSVVITRENAIHDDSMLDDFVLDDSMEDFQPPARTPRPETIVWENLREDVTIPFNFNGDISPCRALPQAEPTEMLFINNTKAPCSTSESEEVPATSDDGEVVAAVSSANRKSDGIVRQSHDATVNLSEFIDASFLAERQQYTPALKTPMIDDHPSNITESRFDSGPASRVLDFELPSTPRHEPFPALPDVPDQAVLQDTPHYALPTIATRRKSVPSISYRTPVNNGARPHTAVGASMPRVLHPFVDMLAAKDELMKTATTPDRKSSIMPGARSLSRNRTPFTGVSLAGTPRLSSSQVSGGSTPMNAYAAGFALLSSPVRSEATLTLRQSPSKTPRMRGSASKNQTPSERFPGLPSRETYEEFAGSPSVKTLSSPAAVAALVSASASKERFPGLPPAQNYEELAEAVANEITAPATTPATPQREVQERYPGLPHRRTYEEHARTALPPTRFRTPTVQAVKRPATTRKPSSLRKIALKAAGCHAPVQTPFKAATMTPGQVPCTPHPNAPLKGVNAYVEVFLSDGSCATTTYISVLQALGAKTTKTFNADRVTHVVYKEGSPTTLQRIRHHNKQVEEIGVGSTIHCVNGRWVNDCKEFGKHMDELDEAYTVELDDFHAAKRRRKSMEPMSLINVGGNVVRDRKSSSNLGRSAMLKHVSSSAEAGASTPPMETTPANKENSNENSFTREESPETPAYLAAPESLVQQTAPANRIRKLDLQASGVKNRRLTFWNGSA